MHPSHSPHKRSKCLTLVQRLARSASESAATPQKIEPQQSQQQQQSVTEQEPCGDDEAEEEFAAETFRQWLSGADGGSTPLEKLVLATAQRTWAKGTWSQRTRLWRNFLRWRQVPGNTHPDMGMELAMFVASHTGTKASTRMTYGTSLASIATRLGRQVPVLRWYISGLSTTPGAMVADGAQPATQQQVARLVADSTLPQSVRAGIFLAWKTASRWDDILGLTRQSFLLVSSLEIVVEWGKLKTNRRQKRTVHSWTVVASDTPMNLLRRHVLSLRADDPFVSTSTRQLIELLRSRTSPRLTAHSFKKGAVDHLVRLAAAGQFDLRKLPQLAKHVDRANDFPASTLRYVSERIGLARSLGTQDATRLL